MRTLVVLAAAIALAAICAAAPANGTNSIFVFAGNTSNGALWSPPVFDEAEGKCKYSKNKALYVTANVTVNGTAIAPFALQALFDGSWAASARIYVYSASVDPAQPCLGVESWDFIAAQRYQTVIALRPGRHSIVVTGVAIGNGSTPGSGTFVVRLIPTRGLLNTANSSVVWRPPVLRRPFNCQQQQAAPRPFLHQTVTVEASGHFAFNVYSSGLPSEVNTTVWVFAGTFTIANGSVANSCEAKFVTGSTTPLMVASPIVNVTKGETYTVAVEFEHPDNRSFWSLSVEPMEVVNTNHTQALFTGVPQFPAKQSEVTVCSASGVQSKYGMHPFKAAYGFYAFDFKKVDIKDAVISLYSGIQTVSTGCNNFIAAVATGESLASRPHSLVVPTTVGSNYTVIVSSQSGQGALYELLVIAGNAQ